MWNLKGIRNLKASLVVHRVVFITLLLTFRHDAGSADDELALCRKALPETVFRVIPDVNPLATG